MVVFWQGQCGRQHTNCAAVQQARGLLRLLRLGAASVRSGATGPSLLPAGRTTLEVRQAGCMCS